jgi:hypothetical protein
MRLVWSRFIDAIIKISCKVPDVRLMRHMLYSQYPFEVHQ